MFAVSLLGCCFVVCLLWQWLTMEPRTSAGTHYIVQADTALMDPLFPQCWDHRCAPHLASFCTWGERHAKLNYLCWIPCKISTWNQTEHLGMKLCVLAPLPQVSVISKEENPCLRWTLKIHTYLTVETQTNATCPQMWVILILEGEVIPTSPEGWSISAEL